MARTTRRTQTTHCSPWETLRHWFGRPWPA